MMHVRPSKKGRRSACWAAKDISRFSHQNSEMLRKSLANGRRISMVRPIFG